MARNPDVYNKFKSERFLPFDDLLALVTIKSGIRVLDLGCGTGELTRKLADALPGSNVLAIDASAEMLQDSKAFANDNVQFAQKTIEAQVESGEKFNLIFQMPRFNGYKTIGNCYQKSLLRSILAGNWHYSYPIRTTIPPIRF